jgi:hypothetical protein
MSESERKHLEDLGEVKEDDEEMYETESEQEEFKLTGNSLFIFPEDSSFRKLMFKTLTHIWFERTMIIIIVISSIQIAISRPLNDPEGTL